MLKNSLKTHANTVKKSIKSSAGRKEKTGVFYPLLPAKVIERSVKKQRKKVLTFFLYPLRSPLSPPLLNNAVVKKYIFFFGGYFIPQSSIVFWIIEGETINGVAFFFPLSLSGISFPLVFFFPFLIPRPVEVIFILCFYYWSSNACHSHRKKNRLCDLVPLFTFLTLRRAFGMCLLFVNVL